MISLFLALLIADPTADELAPHANGAALVEIVSVTEKDMRPADGPLYDEVKLRIVRRSGEVPEFINVHKADGGTHPPPGPVKPAPPKFSVKPGTLKAGQQYWIVFASNHMRRNYPDGVMGVWPADDSKAAKVFDNAVKADHWKWQPRYDPKTGLTCGRLIEPDKKQWRVRVEKGDEVLWETVIPGTPAKRYYSWDFWDGGSGGFPAEVPKVGSLLVAETAQTLAAGNEYDLPTGPYYLCSTFDPHSGKRLSTCVTLHQDPHVIKVQREYHAETSRLLREERFDWPATGGKAIGAKNDDWYRKMARTFDPKTGKVTTENVALGRYEDGR